MFASGFRRPANEARERRRANAGEREHERARMRTESGERKTFLCTPPSADSHSMILLAIDARIFEVARARLVERALAA